MCTDHRPRNVRLVFTYHSLGSADRRCWNTCWLSCTTLTSGARACARKLHLPSDPMHPNGRATGSDEGASGTTRPLLHVATGAYKRLSNRVATFGRVLTLAFGARASARKLHLPSRPMRPDGRATGSDEGSGSR